MIHTKELEAILKEYTPENYPFQMARCSELKNMTIRVQRLMAVMDREKVRQDKLKVARDAAIKEMQEAQAKEKKKDKK